MGDSDSDSGNPTSSTVASAQSKPLNIGHYDPADAEAWFAQAEFVFDLRKINDEQTRAHLLMEAIPRDLYKNIWPRYIHEKRTSTYTSLKEELLSYHSKSPATRAQEFFKHIGVPAGDLSPSTILHTLQNLTEMPKTRTKDACQLNIHMEMMLQRFPKHIRAHLPDYRDMDEKDFLLKADIIAEAHRSANSVIAAAATTTHFDSSNSDSDSDSDSKQMAASLQKPKDRRRQRRSSRRRSSSRRKNDRSHNRSRNRTRNRSTEKPSVCFFHRKFGEKAYKCTIPCAFKPKNLQ